MNNIYFSIIIPVYNAAKTIEECVCSFIDQVDERYEIILVDDGSTDDSYRLCRELSAQLPFIRTIHKSNGGSLSARIAGAEEAKGEYVIYLDADDLLEKNAIQTIEQSVLVTNADLYIFDFYQDKVRTQSKEYVKQLDPTELTVYSGDIKKTIYSTFFEGYLNNMATTIIRRRTLEPTFVYKNTPKIRCGEDRFQKLIVLLAADTIAYVPLAFYYYRWNDGSQSSSSRLKESTIDMFDDFVATYELEQQFYGQAGIDNKMVEKFHADHLARLCSLTEGIILNGQIEVADKKKYVLHVSKNTYFTAILSKELHLTKSKNVFIISSLLKNRRYMLLSIYIHLINALRRLKYSTHQ